VLEEANQRAHDTASVSARGGSTFPAILAGMVLPSYGALVFANGGRV
jgi:hypothetical protein